jgi:proteic killer suppression protein
MVKGFRCADTQALFETGKSKRFSNVTKVATRKLAQLDAANTLEFLPPAATQIPPPVAGANSST